LIDRLKALGVSVERQTELTGFAEEGDHIVARVRMPDDHESICNASYIHAVGRHVARPRKHRDFIRLGVLNRAVMMLTLV
jgi:hypothetical protein